MAYAFGKDLLLMTSVLHLKKVPITTCTSLAAFAKQIKQKGDFKTRDKSKVRIVPLSKKLRTEFEKHKDKHPIIACKRLEYNFYERMKYDKFDPVPCASQSWFHRRSSGDYFTLYEKPATNHHDIHFGNVPFPSEENAYGHESGARESEGPFAKLGLEPTLIEAVKRLGIVEPADIQVAAIPEVLAGKNTVISAHTGCGKTLSFLLPLLQQTLMRKMVEEPETPVNRPLCLIITPSRELAVQLHEVAVSLTKDLPVRTKLLTGGHTRREMMKVDLQDVDVLIASLGALHKNLSNGVYKMDRLIHVVLDEADQLVDDVNSEMLVRMLRHLKIRNNPSGESHGLGAQLTLVSATIPTNLSKRFDRIVSVPDLVRINTTHLHHVLESVPQKFMKVAKLNKGKVLLDLVRDDYAKKKTVLIFSNKISTADWVSLQLNDSGIPCMNLNRKMPISIREDVFKDFQDGKFKILSTTGMAARGLDTVHVEHVINFEFPLYMSEYIHRVGRVGRIGSSESCHVTNIVSHQREIMVVNKIEMAVRTGGALENVNANIPGILTFRNDRQAMAG